VTNLELSATLEALAKKYRENADLEQVRLTAWMYEKQDLAALLKGLGGRWAKEISSEDTFRFSTSIYPGLVIYIPRDKVCRRIVTYECDPIMSPEEEAEVLA
jgi:hypothetical protein